MENAIVYQLLFGLAGGVILTVAGVAACYCKTHIDLQTQNINLSEQVSHLNEQIVYLKRSEKFLFNSYCKSQTIRENTEADFFELVGKVNSEESALRVRDRAESSSAVRQELEITPLGGKGKAVEDINPSVSELLQIESVAPTEDFICDLVWVLWLDFATAHFPWIKGVVLFALISQSWPWNLFVWKISPVKQVGF